MMPLRAPAHAPAVRKSDVPRVAGGVLRHAGQVGHARAFRVLAAHDVAGALRRAHDHVHVLGRNNVAVVDVEAVREGQRVARLQVRLYVLLVHPAPAVRRATEDHDEVGLFGGLVHGAHLQAGLLGRRPRRGSLAQAHAHVAAGVQQVERMGVPLAPIADDGDLLSLDDVGIHVLFVVDGNGHFVFFLSSFQQRASIFTGRTCCFFPGRARRARCMARASSGRTAPRARRVPSRPHAASGTRALRPARNERRPPHPQAAPAPRVRARVRPHPSLELRDMAIFPVRTISLMP